MPLFTGTSTRTLMAQCIGGKLYKVTEVRTYDDGEVTEVAPREFTQIGCCESVTSAEELYEYHCPFDDEALPPVRVKLTCPDWPLMDGFEFVCTTSQGNGSGLGGAGRISDTIEFDPSIQYSSGGIDYGWETIRAHVYCQGSQFLEDPCFETGTNRHCTYRVIIGIGGFNSYGGGTEISAQIGFADPTYEGGAIQCPIRSIEPWLLSESGITTHGTWDEDAPWSGIEMKVDVTVDGGTVGEGGKYTGSLYDLTRLKCQDAELQQLIQKATLVDGRQTAVSAPFLGPYAGGCSCAELDPMPDCADPAIDYWVVNMNTTVGIWSANADNIGGTPVTWEYTNDVSGESGITIQLKCVDGVFKMRGKNNQVGTWGDWMAGISSQYDYDYLFNNVASDGFYIFWATVVKGPTS